MSSKIFPLVRQHKFPKNEDFLPPGKHATCAFHTVRNSVKFFGRTCAGNKGIIPRFYHIVQSCIENPVKHLKWIANSLNTIFA